MNLAALVPARDLARMMQRQEVILKAMAKQLSWLEAAEIAGMSVRNRQRKRQAYLEYGYTGLFDQRRGKRSIHRVPMETAERVLALYRDRYFDLNVRHFHEKRQEEEGLPLSYRWGKQALPGAGLVTRRAKRGPHRRRPPRRPLPGLLLHIAGSPHRWFQDNRYDELLVILDDATSEIDYAQLVEAESTAPVMAGGREVIERKGVFCALYSDRGSHFFYTPKAGEAGDKSRLTQFGRALQELGIQMLAAYSPPARGRMERSDGTWPGRLPQELRLAGLTSLEEANRFLREHYIGEFNAKGTTPAAEKGSAFRSCRRRDWDWVFSIQTERVVSKDHTGAMGDRWWPIEKCRWRHSLAGQTVTIHQHLNGTVSIRFGPPTVGRYTEDGGKDGARENPKPVSPRSLEIAGGDFHCSTVSTTPSPADRKKSRRGAGNSNRTTNMSIKPDNLTN